LPFLLPFLFLRCHPEAKRGTCCVALPLRRHLIARRCRSMCCFFYFSFAFSFAFSFFTLVIPKRSEGPAVALPLRRHLIARRCRSMCCFFYFSLAFSFAFSFAFFFCLFFFLRCHPEAKRGTCCCFASTPAPYRSALSLDVLLFLFFFSLFLCLFLCFFLLRAATRAVKGTAPSFPFEWPLPARTTP
jgi:hypothetical protein